MQVLHYLELGIGIIGVAIIVWGVLVSTVRFVSLEYQHLRRVNICESRNLLRHHLGSYLLLGLEFLVAADVIHTIIKPTKDEILILGSIVIIRTILNFFLNKELKTHSCSAKK